MVLKGLRAYTSYREHPPTPTTLHPNWDSHAIESGLLTFCKMPSSTSEPAGPFNFSSRPCMEREFMS